jgi:hypothetical protein
VKLLRCQQCSAGLHPAPGHPLARCAFCGSTYLIEGLALAPDAGPVRWLPFTQDAAAARAAFARWLSAGFLCPGDLVRSAAASEPAPVLVPLYLGRARAHSNWTAEIVRTRFKKVKVVIPPVGEVKTGDNVRMRSDSHFLSGAHDEEYRDVVVVASSGLPEPVILKIAAYDFSRLAPMPEPERLVHAVEEPQLPPPEAAARMRARIEEREGYACARMVPGGQVADVRVNTVLTDLKVELVYAPIYVINYRYGDRSYRALVNGSTGLVDGDWPLSLPRLATATAALLAIPAALAWILFRRRR